MSAKGFSRESYGSPLSFLRAYLTECLGFGYPDAPLEQEAIVRSRKRSI
jgi:hypothetical protein